MNELQKMKHLKIYVFCFLIYAVVVVSAYGCGPSYPKPQAYNLSNYKKEAPLASCSNVSYFRCKTEDVGDCISRAQSGDVSAMVKLGDIYGDRFYACSEYVDGKKSIHWWEKARENGSSEAVNKLHIIYVVGKLVPKNRRISDTYIEEGVRKRYDWAINADIGRKVRVGDKTAIDDLIRQAIKGNCHAQSDLARFYATGRIEVNDKNKYDVKQNLTKSYFWSLIARAADERKEHYGLYGFKSRCGKSWRLDYKEMKQMPEKLIAKAEDEATNWTLGKPEPKLQSSYVTKAKLYSKKNKKIAKAPVVPKIPKKAKKPDKIVIPNIGKLDLIVGERKPYSQLKWSPVILPESNSGNTSQTSSPEEIFQKVDKHVWKVYAARSINQLKAGINISQGSAVAISETNLLTSCHVVSGNTIIVVKHKDIFDVAMVASGDLKKDKCVLKTSNRVLTPINRIRPYSTLKIGEQVFTVGSPSGLENTLGQGIISGLRKSKDQKLIQTTAQISPGSSGGGLFDRHGNLIGITTFMLKNSQALNFAVAVEEYGR